MLASEVSDLIEMVARDGWSLQVWWNPDRGRFVAVAHREADDGEVEGTDPVESDTAVAAIIQLITNLTE